MVAIAAGWSHNLVLKSDGTVRAWGENTCGEVDVPFDLDRVVAISAGQIHNLALRSDGKVVCWGNGYAGLTTPPSDLTNAVGIACGGSHSVALRADGVVVAWGGDNFSGQTNVPSFLTNVVAISAGAGHTLALLGDGPPALYALLAQPAMGAGGFSVMMQTQSGRVYRMEYETDFSQATWTFRPLVAGSGSPMICTDTAPSASRRFYRVRQW